MKSSKSVKNTLKVAIMLTFILVLFFGKNLVERRHFNELSQALFSVYEDRLVVEGYIFTISENLFRIKLMVNQPQLESDQSSVIEEIEAYENKILSMVKSFEDTQLTEEETEFLSDFKRIIQQNLKISNFELFYKEGVNEEQLSQYNVAIERAIEDLEKLSQIQMQEGQNLVVNAKKIVNKSVIWAQFEVASLVILLVLIYILIQTSLAIQTNQTS